MFKKLYVGNLAPKATEEDVKNLFAEFGEVHSVKIIMDWETGSSRGFGFVEMAAESAPSAISALDGKEYMGLNLRVNEARDRRQGGRRGGGGHSGGFGGRRSGGRRMSW